MNCLSRSAQNILDSVSVLNKEAHSARFIRWRLDVFTRATQVLDPAEKATVEAAIASKRKELAGYLAV